MRVTGGSKHGLAGQKQEGMMSAARDFEARLAAEVLHVVATARHLSAIEVHEVPCVR